MVAKQSNYTLLSSEILEIIRLHNLRLKKMLGIKTINYNYINDIFHQEEKLTESSFHR